MSANTAPADVSEILLGYYLLSPKGTWVGFKGSAEAKRVLGTRKTQIGENEYLIRSSHAQVMALSTHKWMKSKGYDSKIKFVYWTARPGALSKAVKRKVSPANNPTDILIEFVNGKFLGVSAKSSKGSGNIAFKNPGMQNIDKALHSNIKKIVKDRERITIKKFKLPKTQDSRKKYLDNTPDIRKQTDVIGTDLLIKIRNLILRKLNVLSQKMALNHLLHVWLNAEETYPQYIKVTGIGKKAPYRAKVEDPLNNAKLNALYTKKISFKKAGEFSIIVKAGTKSVMRIRDKFNSTKMASSVEFSGE